MPEGSDSRTWGGKMEVKKLTLGCFIVQSHKDEIKQGPHVTETNNSNNKAIIGQHPLMV